MAKDPNCYLIYDIFQRLWLQRKSLIVCTNDSAASYPLTLNKSDAKQKHDDPAQITFHFNELVVVLRILYKNNKLSDCLHNQTISAFPDECLNIGRMHSLRYVKIHIKFGKSETNQNTVILV